MNANDAFSSLNSEATLWNSLRDNAIKCKKAFPRWNIAAIKWCKILNSVQVWNHRNFSWCLDCMKQKSQMLEDSELHKLAAHWNLLIKDEVTLLNNKPVKATTRYFNAIQSLQRTKPEEFVFSLHSDLISFHKKSQNTIKT